MQKKSREVFFPYHTPKQARKNAQPIHGYTFPIARLNTQPSYIIMSYSFRIFFIDINNI